MRTGKSRCKLVCLLILAGAGWNAWAGAGDLPDKGSTQAYERRCGQKVREMLRSHQLTELQFARIGYLLEDQASMIELFARHGLLDESALREKISTIQKVTRLNIDGLLTPAQLEQWAAWDATLDAAEAAKHRVRRRLPPAP